MGLLTAGYWPTTYWPEDYWTDDYWPDYGAVAPTPFPLSIIITESLEYGITLTDAEALSYVLYPIPGLYPATALYPTEGINVTVTTSGGS